MKKPLLRRPSSRGLTALLAAAALMLLAPAAALSGSGDKGAPQKSQGAAHAANPVKPSHATPSHPAKPASSPGKSGDAQHHVIICHRTGSATNPYVVINVSIRAWQHGHQTHPALDSRNDILLQDPATPGEKLPVSRCPSGPVTPPVGTQTTPVVPPHDVVVDATPGVTNVPTTVVVHKPLVIIVNATPNSPVTVRGAGVLAGTKTISDAKGVAKLTVVPTKAGILTVKVGTRTVKRFGVLGASTSGASLTG